MAKILIVDDDPDILEASRLFLEGAGHTVASTDNRNDGMQMAQDGTCDLLILDIMMEQPDDGIAMAQELRKAGFDKPIILMSSISKATGQSYGPNMEVASIDDFLEKPVKPEVLVEKVGALLRNT